VRHVSAEDDTADCNYNVVKCSNSVPSSSKRRVRSNARSTTSSQTRRRNSRRASPRPVAFRPNQPSHILQNRFEKECAVLQKESKAYLDGIRGVSLTDRPAPAGASHLKVPAHHFCVSHTGMSSAQTRVADTIELFYTAADRTSDGALAANAYKRAVEDLDHSITRELVRLPPRPL
jgi:hypothetical protein